MNSEFPRAAGRGPDALRTVLQQLVAEESQLAATMRDYQWRVAGSPLQSVKRLFVEQGRQIDRWLNEMVQCARVFGVVIRGDVDLPRHGGAARAPNAAPTMAMSELAARHEGIAQELREALELAGQRDPDGDAALMLRGVLDFHETSAWMLRLLLESPDQRRPV